MKRLILLALLITAVVTIKSQTDLPYKSLSSFNNDTVAYLVYNFETRADYYKGKTIDIVLKDIRIPVVFFRIKLILRPIGYRSLGLFFNSNTDIISKSCYYLYISSDTSYPENVPRANKWSEKVYESLRSIKVENIGVSVPKNSKYYKEKETKSTNLTPRVVPRDSPVIHKWDPDKP